MQIPRFWAVAEGSGTGPAGERRFRRLWGWSMSSAEEALAVAAERLRAAMISVGSSERKGSYYPRVPLREPILDELTIDGEQAVVLTRNRYGAEILNTDRLLIADIDIPELDRRRGGRVLGRLFRRSQAADDPPVEPPVVLERLSSMARWAATNPQLGVIVYRTASGLRVFVTGIGEPATSAEGEHAMTELGADPIYRELCRTHGTFRARLTPKPWRLPRMRSPIDRWPFGDPRTERRFQRWLADYETAARGYAVCRRLAAHGPRPSAMEEQIIRLHDDRTGVSAPLPLA